MQFALAQKAIVAWFLIEFFFRALTTNRGKGAFIAISKTGMSLTRTTNVMGMGTGTRPLETSTTKNRKIISVPGTVSVVEEEEVEVLSEAVVITGLANEWAFSKFLRFIPNYIYIILYFFKLL